MDAAWRLAELQARTADALQAAGIDGVDNGRVRDVPDARTIRYYTTLGLIDRSAEMKGRTAFYGRRHLLQLVAIKRLQAAGKSLAEVQQQIVGITDRRLASLAAVPAAFWDEPTRSVSRPSDAAAKKSSRQTEPKWDGPPWPSSSELESVPLQDGQGRPSHVRPAAAREAFWMTPAVPAAERLPAATAAITAIRLPVAEGVTLELSGDICCRLTDENLTALKPLLENLAQELNHLTQNASNTTSSDSTTSSQGAPYDHDTSSQ